MQVKDSADSRLQAGMTASPETQKKLTGIMSKVKEGAEKAKEEIEKAKREFEDRITDEMSEKGGTALGLYRI